MDSNRQTWDIAAKHKMIVAGHICLDILPALDALTGGLDALTPGTLYDLPPARIATGGAVANTGLALHRLGVPVRLIGKIGQDGFGLIVRDILAGYDPALAEGLIVSPDQPTGHDIVLSLPGVDRMFLCCPGANDSFSSEDVRFDDDQDASLFHLGYPPLLRRMFEDDGRELETLLEDVHRRGLTVSLDMSKPDPNSPAGKANWPSILRRVLPHVDIFLPSLDEILYMIDRPQFEQLPHNGENNQNAIVADMDIVRDVAQRLLDLGVAVVVLKLGEQGLYLRTTSNRDRLTRTGRCLALNTNDWAGRELYAPCFQVDIAGTTGAGDSTIAGFLAALARDMGPEDTIISAVGVGAFCVEQHDAASGIPSWKQMRERVQAGWARREGVRT